MEKRIIGIVLTLLGVAGLILAGSKFMQGGGNTYNVKAITTYGLLGLIFFLSGIALIRNTRDKAT